MILAYNKIKLEVSKGAIPGEKITRAIKPDIARYREKKKKNRIQKKKEGGATSNERGGELQEWYMELREGSRLEKR